MRNLQSSPYLLPLNAQLIAIMLSMAPAYAENISMDADSLMNTARQFIAQLPDSMAGITRVVQVTTPDPRLQLAACPTPVQAFWPNTARTTGTTVVGIRCPAPGGWQVFLNVSIQEMQNVLVAARPLGRGDSISAQDVAIQAVPRSQLRGQPLLKAAELEGLSVRFAIAANDALTYEAVCLVCRGDSVMLAAGDERFSVKVQAVAEGYGNRGDKLMLINSSSKRRVGGIVTGKGEAKTP